MNLLQHEVFTNKNIYSINSLTEYFEIISIVPINYNSPDFLFSKSGFLLFLKYMSGYTKPNFTKLLTIGLKKIIKIYYRYNMQRFKLQRKHLFSVRFVLHKFILFSNFIEMVLCTFTLPSHNTEINLTTFQVLTL